MPLRSAVPVPGPRPGTRPAPPRSSPTTTADVELVATTDTEAVTAADETVDKLLDEGRSPADVLLVTTGDQHPWAQHELSFGEEAYWRQQTEGDDVFCAHVSATDQVRPRPIVVLAVNGGSDEQVAEALPSAMQRAASRLIVCGDPQRLRTLL